jgi:hypothetical protein
MAGKVYNLFEDFAHFEVILLFPNNSNEEVYDSNLDFNAKSSDAVQSEA